MVEQARKDIKTVYGNFKVTGFDKVHKKLSQVIDQQAVKLDPVANAKVKLVSQKMGTTARMVGHQLANVRLLILWLQNQERSFEEMNVTRAYFNVRNGSQRPLESVANHYVGVATVC